MRPFNARWAVLWCVLALLLVILHLAYSAQSKSQILQGTFFASGVVIMSGGQMYESSLRLQSHGDKLHDFETLNKNTQNFSLTQVSSLFGSARFVIEQKRDTAWLKANTTVDRDIAFNYAYYSNIFSRFSFYKLHADSRSQCFYIKELDAVRCYGAER